MTEPRGEKGDTYEGGMKVPYIFKWSGKIEAGSVCDDRIIGVDIYPTLISMAKINPPESYPLDGIDLSPVLQGKANNIPERQVYCFYPKYAQFKTKTGKWIYSWRNVIYDGNFKLIEYPEYDEYELFDLDADISEKNNLADKQPEKSRILTHDLHGWLDEIDAPKLEPNPNYTLD